MKKQERIEKLEAVYNNFSEKMKNINQKRKNLYANTLKNIEQKKLERARQNINQL